MKNKDIVNVEIGNRIREARIVKNMTQEALAEKVNFATAQHMSSIECGVKGISIPKLIELCKVLDVEADYILFGVKKANAETLIGKYLDKMTDEQAEYVLELVKVYAKSCGIE